MILREIFGGICDGCIAPRMFSPFHPNNVMHEEIVIFDPKKSLVVYNSHNSANSPGTLPTHHISTQLRGTTVELSHHDLSRRVVLAPMQEGGCDSLHAVDRNAWYDDPKNVAEGKRLARAFKRSIKVDFKDADSIRNAAFPACDC